MSSSSRIITINASTTLTLAPSDLPEDVASVDEAFAAIQDALELEEITVDMGDWGELTLTINTITTTPTK